MEAPEQSLILKGKRTKRQRPQSPIPFSIAPPISPHESTSLDDNYDSNTKNPNAAQDDEDVDDNTNNKGITNGVTKSASSASSFSTFNNATDQEDQDMAHCLILLAQGHSLSHHREMNNNNNDNGFRFNSRRFLETSSANGGGKAGYYVYQCKTCDRTFPSFQALGGHRASHKKPKNLHSDDLKKTIYNNTFSLHLNNNNNHRELVMYGSKVSNNKVHECGICGAEFTSGQALGGHMRRHRGAVVAAASASASAATATANTALSLSPMLFDQSDGQDYPVKKRRSSVVSLDLDLNLPAPDDENRVTGLGFAAKQEHHTEHEQQKQREEQKSLALSAPTLVDCQY